jgi:plasmid stabilization system protein ParE
VVRHLPKKCEALSSNPSAGRRRRRGRGRRRKRRGRRRRRKRRSRRTLNEKFLLVGRSTFCLKSQVFRTKLSRDWIWVG